MFLTQITEFILSLIGNLGYLGIFIGMTIESSFFPFPSEIILIPAGALVSRGEMLFLPVFIASLLGSILGALINFYLAFFFGRKTVDFLTSKYGKFLFLTKESLRKTDIYFKKHGEITVFVGRLIPLVRQEISLPAGFAKMNLSKFLIFTVLGAGIWSVFLISIGYFFGSNARPGFKLIAGIIILAFLITIIYYVFYSRKRKH